MEALLLYVYYRYRSLLEGTKVGCNRQGTSVLLNSPVMNILVQFSTWSHVRLELLLAYFACRLKRQGWQGNEGGAGEGRILSEVEVVMKLNGAEVTENSHVLSSVAVSFTLLHVY